MTIPFETATLTELEDDELILKDGIFTIGEEAAKPIRAALVTMIGLQDSKDPGQNTAGIVASREKEYGPMEFLFDMDKGSISLNVSAAALALDGLLRLGPTQNVAVAYMHALREDLVELFHSAVHPEVEIA